MNYNPNGGPKGPRPDDYFPPPGAGPGDFENMPPIPGAMMYPPHFHGILFRRIYIIAKYLHIIILVVSDSIVISRFHLL